MPAKKILVVDDEPNIVDLVATALAKRGFDVLRALDPSVALEMVNDIALKNGSPVDLILSDVMMPNMNGPQLVAEVQRLSPSTVALFISGYSCQGILPGSAPFLGKPFTIQKLLLKVGEVLASSAQSAGA